MDYIGETICLSIDSIIFGLCMKSYLKGKQDLKAIQNAPEYQLDVNFRDIIKSHNGYLPYVALRGNIKPLGPVIRSMNQPSTTGVIQKLIIKEHVWSRNSSGFWTENERTINEVYNSIPFALVSKHKKGIEVEVVEALSAEILDLEVVSDRYDPSTLGFMDHLWGFFTGIRKRGLQTVEEILKDGAYVTAVGEVKGDSGVYTIQPPINGTPYFITTMPLASLVRRFEEKVSLYGWLSFALGLLGIVISGVAFRKFWKKRLEWLKAEENKKRLDSTRRERRQRVRDIESVPEERLCVVCQTHPKEVILIPCGHVCLCEDCNDQIQDECPVCKTKIESTNPAYIA